MAIQFDHTANGLVTITTTDASSPTPYTLRLPNGTGIAGQVLGTDGTGNLFYTGGGIFEVVGGNTISSCTMTSHPDLNTTCFNFFAGQFAGRCNTTGAFNFFAGKCAGSCNTTGSNNIFIGLNAGQCNTTGEGNNFFGSLGGYNTTTGSNNNFLGFAAGGQNTTGSYNTFIGYQAGFNNISGNRNNFLGIQAGFSNTTGCDNNFIGRITGYQNTTGCNNNFIGFGAGACNTTGSKNIYLGCDAGCVITTGNNNIILGSVSSGLAAATSNVILFATGNTQRYCYSAATGNTTILGNIISNGGVFFGSGAGLTAINYCNVTVNRPAANILLTGDVTGSANAILTPGSTVISIDATIAPNSVALGTDTTGDYVAGITAGTGITVTGTAGEGWSPTVSANTTYLDGRYLVLDNAALQTVTGPVAFNGNVFFEGAVTYVGAQNLTVEDSIITLADNNTADVVDIGIVGRYDTTKYTGFFRDASDGVWRLFKEYTGYDNTETTIDITDASYAYADLVVQKLTANSTVDSNSTSTGSIITLGGAGVAGNLFVGGMIVSGSGHTVGANAGSCSTIIGGCNNSISGLNSSIIATRNSCVLHLGSTDSSTAIIAGSSGSQIQGSTNSAILGSEGYCILSSSYVTIIGSGASLACANLSGYSGIINSYNETGGLTCTQYSTILSSLDSSITSASGSLIGGGCFHVIKNLSYNSAIIGGICGNISGGRNSVIIGGFQNTIANGNAVILGGVDNSILRSGCQGSFIAGSRASTSLGCFNSVISSCSSSASDGNFNTVIASNLNSGPGSNNLFTGVFTSCNSTVGANSCYSSVMSSMNSSICTGGIMSTIFGTCGSSINGRFSTIIGGINTCISGRASAVLGGCYADVTANTSAIIGGVYGLNDIDGKVIIPGHSYNAAPWQTAGSAQIGKQSLLGNTSSTVTIQDLYSSAGGFGVTYTEPEFNRAIGIRNSHVYTIKGTVTAANTTGTTKVWEYTTVARADATGTISFIGNYGTGNAIINTIAADSGTSSWDIRFVSGGNATLQKGWITANVTGSADTIKWLLTSESSELKFA